MKKHGKYESNDFFLKILFQKKINSELIWKPILKSNSHQVLNEIKHQSYQSIYCKEFSNMFISKTYTWIDDPIQIPKIIENLLKECEISINVEYQSQWSYLGFICLLQIGTRSRDYLFDTIKLKTSLRVLNIILKSSKIVKILHGSKCNISRLQHDLGLYFINLFDTYEAICILKWYKNSFQALIPPFCQINLKESYKTCDWSLRPLTLEMIIYARSKVCYLFHVYDRLRNLLLEKGKNCLITVLNRSKALCLKVFNKPIINFNILSKCTFRFNKKQSLAFQILIVIKDKISLYLNENNSTQENFYELGQLSQNIHNFENFYVEFTLRNKISLKHKKIITLIVKVCLKKDNIGLIYKYFFKLVDSLIYFSKFHILDGYNQSDGFISKRKYFPKSKVKLYKFKDTNLSLFFLKKNNFRLFQCIYIPLDPWFINFLKKYKNHFSESMRLPLNLRRNINFSSKINKYQVKNLMLIKRIQNKKK